MTGAEPLRGRLTLSRADSCPVPYSPWCWPVTLSFGMWVLTTGPAWRKSSHSSGSLTFSSRPPTYTVASKGKKQAIKEKVGSEKKAKNQKPLPKALKFPLPPLSLLWHSCWSCPPGRLLSSWWRELDLEASLLTGLGLRPASRPARRPEVGLTPGGSRLTP